MATTATTFELSQEFARKLEIVTAGLPPEYSRLLQDKIPRQYATTTTVTNFFSNIGLTVFTQEGENIVNFISAF